MLVVRRHVPLLGMSISTILTWVLAAVFAVTAVVSLASGETGIKSIRFSRTVDPIGFWCVTGLYVFCAISAAYRALQPG
jgi:hypothetical protein